MKTDTLPLLFRKILSFRRKLRFRFILSKVKVKPQMRVCDVGCGPNGRSFEDFAPLSWEIVGVDILPPEKIRHSHPNFRYVCADARDLGIFKDQEFDLAVSIGMLEHVPDEGARKVAEEIRRIGKQYIVVVPYRYCWVEPHYGIPFFPVFPYRLKLLLIRALNLSNQRSTVKEDRNFVKKHYFWRTNREYLKWFPDAKIYLTPTLETIAVVKKAEI